MNRPGFAELRSLRGWLLMLAAAAMLGCAAPKAPPKPQPPAMTTEERQRQAEVLEALRKRKAELKAEEDARAAAQQEEYKNRLKAQLAEQQRIRDSLPSFQAELKAGDRVAARSMYALGTVIELKRPLALVQLELTQNMTRRYEMRWIPVAELWPPIIWAPGS